MSSLGIAFPQEQARLRELLSIYRGIPSGAFAAAMIEEALQRADKAAIEQDVIAMIRIYQEMKAIE